MNIIEGLAKSDTTHAALIIVNKHLKKPDAIYDCQVELIENGFEAFAQI